MDTHPVLDWKARFNTESLDYKIDRLTAAPMKGRNCTWKRTLWLDQGNEGACTGFGLSHVLGTTPRRVGGIDNPYAQQRYYRARQEDQWPGENYDGSSVLGAMEAAKDDGIITSYHWATTLEEIVYGVSYHGPMEIGINWYEGMWTPDANGLLQITGKIAGGHALCIGGVNMKAETFLLYNSWGPTWGNNGGALISFDNMNRLLKEEGEFALPKKKVQK